MKRLFILISAVFLSGCASGGSSYSSLEHRRPTKGMAEIIIYHPSGELTGSVPLNEGPDVKVNGKIVCALPNGSYCVTSVTPGNEHISSTKFMAIGTSELDIQTKPNKRYFVRITWSGDKVWSTAAFGLVGEGVSEATSSHKGPFFIELVSEQTAMTEIPTLSSVNEH